MKLLLAGLGLLLVGAAVWAVTVFSKPPPTFGPTTSPPPTPEEVTPQDLNVLAMDLLQGALAAEMRLFVEEGAFTDEPEELPTSDIFVAAPTADRVGQIAVEVCAGDTVVVLETLSAGAEDVFAVKARGLEPHADGEAVFSHYTADATCDASDGAETWPGGYRVSRKGLMKGDERADIPLE